LRKDKGEKQSLENSVWFSSIFSLQFSISGRQRRENLLPDATVNLAYVFVSPWRQCKHICCLFALVMEAFYTEFIIAGNKNVISEQKQREFFTTVTKADLANSFPSMLSITRRKD